MEIGLVIFGSAVAAFEWLSAHHGVDSRDGDDWMERTSR